MPDSSLPPDIAAEKSKAWQIKLHYRNRMFKGLRSFRALRLEAPGIIAKNLIGVVISAIALFVLLRDMNATGLAAVLYIIYILVVIGLSFWAAAWLWRAIGLEARNTARYVVTNMWSLLAASLFVVSLVGSIFLPELTRKPASPEKAQRVGAYSGEGWEILTNLEGSDYVPYTIHHAHSMCRDKGGDWYLADKLDFDLLSDALIAAGHRRDFWAADRKDNSYLYYRLTDTEAEPVWSLSPRDHLRAVLCVDRARVGAALY